MVSPNKRWEANIAEAMSETQKAQRETSTSATIMLPNWAAFGVCILFGFLFAKTVVTGVETHPVSSDRDYQTGSSVALLMAAEDVEHYRTTYGKLPDQLPSPIGAVIDISYEKINSEHFRLTMPHGDSKIVFDAQEDKLSME